jgi:hypothetical protein
VSGGLLVDQCCAPVYFRHLVELNEEKADRSEEEGAESGRHGDRPLWVERVGEQASCAIDNGAERGFQLAGQAAEYACGVLRGASIAQPDAAAPAPEAGLT